MAACRACGHPLDDLDDLDGHDGRATATCPGCGRAVDGEIDWRTDTAERPRVRPVPREPPHAIEPPPPARFPLYADEYDDPAPPAETPAETPPETPAETPDGSAPVRPGAGSADDDWFAWAARAEDALPHAYDDPGWDDDPSGDDERRSAGPWMVLALLILVAVLAAWWFLARA